MARYLGNKSKKEVHDQHNERPNCQLSEIKERVQFSPDTLTQARKEGYDNCHYCIGGSTR